MPIRTRFVLLSAVGNGGRCGIQSGHCLRATPGIPSIEEASVVNRFIGSRHTCTRVHLRYTRVDAYFCTGYVYTVEY